MRRLPFFGLLTHRSPMDGLLRHYQQIAKGMELIQGSLECYIEGGTCRDFHDLRVEVDKVENKADEIKRNIRNHLPRGLFMAVDKTLFFNYTRSQDNILDAGQEALNWLGMRTVSIPPEYRKGVLGFQDQVIETVTRLEPALESTIDLLHGRSLGRQEVKEKIRDVRDAHHDAWRQRADLDSAIYNSEMEFKDIYQLLHFVDRLYSMSHNAEGCADILRAMMAR